MEPVLIFFGALSAWFFSQEAESESTGPQVDQSTVVILD